MDINQLNLQELDWQIRIALASDKLTTVNQVFAKLDFFLTSPIKNVLQKSTEMNVDELNILYTSLKQASEAVEKTK